MARATLGIPGGGYEGKFGNAVFYRSGEETYMRPLVTPHDPRTALQIQARLEFGRAAQAWGRLTDAEFAAWEAAGGYRLFMSLTRKWLRMHPAGTPPTLPPSGPFMGDNVRFSIGDFRLTDVPHPCPSPSEGRGVLTIDADRSNSAGVVTEVLLQPLANARRKPKLKAWKTAGFYAFTDTVRTVDIPVAPGAYAVAYRFVDSATGQETAMAVLASTTAGAVA